MSEARNQRRRDRRLAPRIMKAAVKYDLDGCEVCGHQPRGHEMYPIGRIGHRVVGVCNQHVRRLDTILSVQFFVEGEENIKRRKMAERVATDGLAH